MEDGANFKMIKKDNHLNSKSGKDNTQVDYLDRAITSVFGDSVVTFINKDDYHIYHFLYSFKKVYS